MLTNCGSINLKRDSGAKTVKMPFAEEDYQDNNSYFYSIQSTKGSGSRSAIKNATLTYNSIRPVQQKVNLFWKNNFYWNCRHW